MDNTQLNRHYEINVQMFSDETRRTIDSVMPKIEQILVEVSQDDERFKSKPLKVGSYFSHLKVCQADEFDFGVVLDIPEPVWKMSPPHNCYYDLNDKGDDVVKTKERLQSPPVGQYILYVPSSVSDWNDMDLNDGEACITYGYDIIPIKLKKRFKTLVTEAIHRLRLSGEVDMNRLSDSPATTLTISGPHFPVSIDLCPVVEARLSFIPSFGWPRRDKLWPSQEVVDTIQKSGITFVAKSKLYWQVSFAMCEKTLLRKIDVNGTFRRKTGRIMKRLREQYWSPKGKKKALTSYHLKNILFWECETYPKDSDWDNEHLGTRIESMCKRLIELIREKEFPCYFHVGIDFFKGKDYPELDATRKRIEKFLQDPDRYLEVP